MATASRATQAQAHLFMRRCRRQPLSLPFSTTVRTASTSSSIPSNFNNTKPLSPPPSKSPSPSDSTPKQRSLFERPTPAPWHYQRAIGSLPPVRAPSRLKNFLRDKLGFRFYEPPTGDPAPFTIHNNPYRARKKWPPDLTKLHSKQQFHFEKTYRRRSKLKWARPRWNRNIKLLQNTLIVSITLYWVFILEPSHGQGTPFDGLRVWFFGKLKRLSGLNVESVAEVERLEKQAKQDMKDRRTFFQWLREDKETRGGFMRWASETYMWNPGDGEEEDDEED